MIKRTKGNILKADTEALVNTVNCVGVMGRGIALQFKKTFPANFKFYATACQHGQVQPGQMLIFETGQLTNPRYIINFPTKRHWKGMSKIEDIDSGLAALVEEIRTRNIRSISIPPLGSGLGGLNWNDVRDRIERAMAEIPEVDVIIFEPDGSKVRNVVASSKVPEMTSGRAALIGLVHRYLDALLDPFVSLLEVHKLMYFMQSAGQPLRLNFTKGTYGPYSQNLRHVLHAIEGHYISGYADGGDDPTKLLHLVPGALTDAEALLETESETQSRFARVVDLVEGFETPFGLELLATIHWLAIDEKITDKDALVRAIYDWNERKRQFSPRQIELASSVLATKGWLN